MGRNAFYVALCVMVLVVSAGCSTPPKKKEISFADKARLERLRSALQFAVSIGGQKAKPCSEICAKIDSPVAKDAKVVFGVSGNEVVLATIYPCDAEGVAVSGGKPASIVVYGGNQTFLNKTSDGKSLAPGYHLMDVSSSGKNARVLFKISK